MDAAFFSRFRFSVRRKAEGTLVASRVYATSIGARSDVIPYIRPLRLGSGVGEADRQQACQYDPEPIFKSDF
jgi:hypothetical protein